MPIFSTGVSSLSYNGIHEINVTLEELDQLHKEKFLPIASGYKFSQNEYIVIKSSTGSALGRYVNDGVILLNQSKLDKATSIKPKNKEQYFAIDALTDDSIKVACLTGLAGTGKTFLALAAAISKIEEGKYKKIILTRPSSQVGRRELGILPGIVEEKFMPYLINYVCNLEIIFQHKKNNAGKLNMEMLFSRYNIEIVPMQLLRGASFAECLVIADELQVCDYHEMLTLGTRMAEGSKLIIMGDLNQRDEQISRDKTGLYKFINDPVVRDSNFTASVNLLKSERGEVSALFSKVFEAY